VEQPVEDRGGYHGVAQGEDLSLLEKGSGCTLA